jgi:hypothetical protein
MASVPPPKQPTAPVKPTVQYAAPMRPTGANTVAYPMGKAPHGPPDGDPDDDLGGATVRASGAPVT